MHCVCRCTCFAKFLACVSWHRLWEERKARIILAVAGDFDVVWRRYGRNILYCSRLIFNTCGIVEVKVGRGPEWGEIYMKRCQSLHELRLHTRYVPIFGRFPCSCGRKLGTDKTGADTLFDFGRQKENVLYFRKAFEVEWVRSFMKVAGNQRKKLGLLHSKLGHFEVDWDNGKHSQTPKYPIMISKYSIVFLLALYLSDCLFSF